MLSTSITSTLDPSTASCAQTSASVQVCQLTSGLKNTKLFLQKNIRSTKEQKPNLLEKLIWAHSLTRAFQNHCSGHTTQQQIKQSLTWLNCRANHLLNAWRTSIQLLQNIKKIRKLKFLKVFLNLKVMKIQLNSSNLATMLTQASLMRSLSTSLSSLKVSISAQDCVLHPCSTLLSPSNKVHQREDVSLHLLMIS